MSPPVSRVAILGGGGFFATHLARQLNRAHPEISIVAVEVRTDLPCRVPAVDYRLGVDLGDARSVAACIRGADAVINTVGLVTFSRREAARVFRANAELALSAAQACVGARVPWLIHMSSVAAVGYAARSAGPTSEDFEFDWTVARRKRRYYMLSKREGDLLLAAVGPALTGTIVYPGLMIGPGDVVNTARLYGAATGAISLAPPGVTNVVDVRDVAAGIISILERRAEAKRLILGGENLSYRELFTRIRRLAGIRGPVIPVPGWLRVPLTVAAEAAEEIASSPIVLTGANVDASFTWRAHSSKSAEQAIGFAPRFSVEQSFADFVAGAKRIGAT